ncbi:MAG: fucose isomerase, partial [Chitinivibrionales bacterium]|nr:fucose isomerase [Chitinivibrionales bacterium]
MAGTKSSAVRIGIMSFSDGRKRVHDTLRPSIEQHQETLAKVLEQAGVAPVIADEIAWTPRLAVAGAKQLVAADVAAVVFNIPVFAFPNLAGLAATVLRKPVAIVSPGEANLPGMGGLLAAGGALRQMGITEERIWGPYDSDASRRRL